VPIFFLKITSTMNVLQNRGAGTLILPTTDRILEPFEDVAPPIVLIILMYPAILAGELIWRERDAEMDPLADSAPVGNGARFVGKLLGLGLVLAAIQVLILCSDLITQVWLGWYDFDLPQYGKIIGLQLVDVLLFAVFAIAVHVLVNNKHVGNVLVLVLVAASRIIAEQLHIEHPLLILGYEPAWQYSPISGFGADLPRLLWFKLYWGAWAVFLAIVASLFWQRGIELGFSERARVARRQLTGRVALAGVASFAAVLVTGGFIFYNTNVLNEFVSSEASAQLAADYEREYGRFRSVAQPEMIATDLNVEIYPDRGVAEVRGVHHLVNRSAGAIERIHVAISSEVETEAVELDRSASSEIVDDELKHRVYLLTEPLQPGDSLRMSWEVRSAPRGFTARGSKTSVVANGTMIEMAYWMPLIGYQPRRELTDPAERLERGLPPRLGTPSLYDVAARSDASGRTAISLDVTIGTALGQTAVAPGPLVRSWTENGRSYFHYVTDTPVGLDHALFSAEYEIDRARWGDVELEVVHHPAHDMNVERTLRGMQASLAQMSERFGPYPYKTLRFVEYASPGGSLHATPGTIWYQEMFSLMDVEHERRDIDLPFAVTGHEVGHQWWGGQAAHVEGAAMLSESLAWYSALGVVEHEYGPEHLGRLLDFMRESYREPRSRADVPLLRASDQFLAYRKGPLAMYALREYVGQEHVDSALRRFKARVSSPEPPFATTLDLYAELQAVTPDSLQWLLGDLFERNTFWELRTDRATVEPAGGGEWRVSVEVFARKVAVDTAGVETEIPMDDLIEIGAYAVPVNDTARSKPVHAAMHRIRSGPQTITITVPAKPTTAGIDPRHLLIDVQPADNVVVITEASSPSARRPRSPR
jgi:ABC-2 type transport system permease protein